jgi:outer membrane receptor protein involved in Fe transport
LQAANVLFSREYPQGVVARFGPAGGGLGPVANLRFDADVRDAAGTSVAWQPGADWARIAFPPLFTPPGLPPGAPRFVAPYPASLLKLMVAVSSGRVSPPDWKPKVDAHTTYDLGLGWTGIKGLTVTGVIKNLLDKDPPLAITYDSNFGSGSSWEPRVADPRGRAFVLSAEYRF